MSKIKLELNKGVLTDGTINEIFQDNEIDIVSGLGKFKIDNFENDLLKSISASELNQYSYINMKYVRKTENNFKLNTMVQSMSLYFNKQSIKEVIHKYRIGTSKTWQGATVFWYIDNKGKVCSGEVMKYENLYNEPIGFEGKPFIDSIRTILYKQGFIGDNFNQKSILFGEHLLKDNKKPIGIVESEKTAIMASLMYPNFTWLATGINYSLTFEKIKVLMKNDVTLFPTNDKFHLWYKKAFEYGFKISLLAKKEFGYSDNPKADLSNCILEMLQSYEYMKDI